MWETVDFKYFKQNLEFLLKVVKLVKQFAVKFSSLPKVKFKNYSI